MTRTNPLKVRSTFSRINPNPNKQDLRRWESGPITGDCEAARIQHESSVRAALLQQGTKVREAHDRERPLGEAPGRGAAMQNDSDDEGHGSWAESLAAIVNCGISTAFTDGTEGGSRPPPLSLIHI